MQDGEPPKLIQLRLFTLRYEPSSFLNLTMPSNLTPDEIVRDIGDKICANEEFLSAQDVTRCIVSYGTYKTADLGQVNTLNCERRMNTIINFRNPKAKQVKGPGNILFELEGAADDLLKDQTLVLTITLAIPLHVEGEKRPGFYSYGTLQKAWAMMTELSVKHHHTGLYISSRPISEEEESEAAAGASSRKRPAT
jgi:hypothetical protein